MAAETEFADKNGAPIHFVSMIAPVIKLDDQTATCKVFPSPANDLIQVRYELMEKSSVSIVIADQNGHIVNRIDSGNEEPAGVHVRNLNVGAFPGGLYNVMIYINGLKTNRLITNKILILH
jgi:hypothetical protein